MPNLDNAHAELVKAMTPMSREEFETKILTDKAFFADYAWKYMGSAEGYRGGLLGWAWRQYEMEITPQFKEAWTNENKIV